MRRSASPAQAQFLWTPIQTLTCGYGVSPQRPPHLWLWRFS